MEIEATTLQIAPELVRTIGRGSLLEDPPPPSLKTSRYEPGEVVAEKYRLINAIARGGMGEVWLATHESLKTDVAVKFSDHGTRSDPNRTAVILERFLFEARISARLGARTKHIVAVLDAGTYNGVPYLVMEYVRGRTLDEEVSKQGPLAPERLATVLDQVADALDVAHGLGVVHRDIKPANVMLFEEHHRLTVKVADFGVSKIVRPDLLLDRPRETPPNALIGSPAYMSPEQMRGANSVLDLRSDLWSLGILVYEALTTELPFSGKTVADLIVAISTLPPTLLSKKRPDLGTAFDGWLEKALAKTPAHRFASAREMAAAFRACLAPPVRRTLRASWILGGLLAACGAIAAAILITRAEPSTPTSPQISAQPSSEVAPTTLSTLSPPIVEPMSPVTTAPTSAPVPSGAPQPQPANAEPLTASATAEPATTSTAASSTSAAPPATNAPIRKRPRKEFDPSEIQ